MNDNPLFTIVGGLLLLSIVIAVVVAAVMAVATIGSVIGASVSLSNYGKSFLANVELERPSGKV